MPGRSSQLGRFTGLKKEMSRTVQQPARIKRMFSRQGYWYLKEIVHPTTRADWVVKAGSSFRRRNYGSYSEYRRHQASKLRIRDVRDLDARIESALYNRLRGDWSGEKVLCLGARLGGEVRAFTGRGAFAVGVDLNPGNGNRWVLSGDFHALQFADESVDAVYTNSLDHVLDLEKLLSEVKRVLQPAGVFLVDAVGGEVDRGSGFGYWASLSWQDTGELIAAIEAFGFEMSRRESIDSPWVGEHVEFVLGAGGS